jgi:EAL domain-containing protein (putative c-di-GMP-specific phosphodiesterase class I)
MDEWLSPLRTGNVVIGVRRLIKGPMHDLMLHLQTVSMLQVPIMINGVYSGEIVFDDCDGEHEQTRAQINILKLLVPLIAVNVSLAQLKAGKEFVRDVKETLARWELEPGDLELDVTESALARTTLSQSDVLEELSRLGVRIAIDEFGAQYSSLDYLRTYRVGRLKIARHMVAAASDERGGQAMIRAIIALAAELGVEVVAEGVETKEQRATLVKISANTKGQRFYFSQPMPAESTTQNLRLNLRLPDIGGV